MHFAPQFGSPIEMDQITYDSLSHVTSLITSENRKIEEAYKNAWLQNSKDEQSDRIVDTLDSDVA